MGKKLYYKGDRVLVDFKENKLFSCATKGPLRVCEGDRAVGVIDGLDRDKQWVVFLYYLERMNGHEERVCDYVFCSKEMIDFSLRDSLFKGNDQNDDFGDD